MTSTEKFKDFLEAAFKPELLYVTRFRQNLFGYLNHLFGRITDEGMNDLSVLNRGTLVQIANRLHLSHSITNTGGVALGELLKKTLLNT
jgi:hypothetical protein